VVEDSLACDLVLVRADDPARPLDDRALLERDAAPSVTPPPSTPPCASRVPGEAAPEPQAETSTMGASPRTT
jgi:hypothetical protein